MKIRANQKTQSFLAVVFSLVVCHFSFLASASTTMDPLHHYAYGGNIGWLESRGDVTSGAVVGEYVCSGYIYGANVGWINLGSGFPTNGIQYRNVSTNDFGVNIDSNGNLSGYAWGANIGWIIFTNGTATGALSSVDSPKVDMFNGKFGGFAYGANCGWISLSNAADMVVTDRIASGADLNADGIPDAWEIQNFGTTNINVNADADGDGISNLQEYLAGTNPNDASDFLRITGVARDPVAVNTTLQWTGVPTRAYFIQSRQNLSSGTWADVVGFGLGANHATFDDGTSSGLDFYRIRAYRPLGP